MDYITIIQGDDTNFLGDQFLVINFNTDIDLSGFTATFSLGDVTLTYGDLSGKNFEVILSDEITSNLKLGKQYGELKLIDTEQRIRTITSVIPFLVRKGVNEDIIVAKNSLNISMNINDTIIEVNIETAGISRTEANRIMSYCNNAQQNAQNYSNDARNTLNELYSNTNVLNQAVDNAYLTCQNNVLEINNTKETAITEVNALGNEKIELATQQANIATEKTQEVSDTYTTAMTDINTAKTDSISEIIETKEDSISEIDTTTTGGKESLNEIANELLYKWNLFDLIQKDHILSFKESQGLALLGTYVYKNSIAGERYGYPTFYETCLNEMQEAIETTITLGSSEVTVYQNSNGHTYYNIADKEIFDNFYLSYGVAWYYGVDTENERIFLPRNDWFFQSGSTNNINSFTDAGLPSITHTHTRGSMNITGQIDYHVWGNGCSGAFYANGRSANKAGTGNDNNCPYTRSAFSADRTWSGATSNNSAVDSVYGNSNTVQTKSVKTLIYICVGNTYQQISYSEWDDNAVAVNDTLPLAFAHYDTINFNHISWLRSEGQSVSGKIYKTIYAELVTALAGSNPKGYKVIDITQKENNVDYSEYWQINQDDMTFIMPTKTGSSLDSSGLYLYFKVANTVENLELLDLGKVTECLNAKISREDCVAYIIETYYNGSSWYRVWSDGWCEQGIMLSVNANTTFTWVFLKPYKDSNYLVFSRDIDTLNTTVTSFKIANKTVSQVQTKCIYTGGAITVQLLAQGYIA